MYNRFGAKIIFMSDFRKYYGVLLNSMQFKVDSWQRAVGKF